MITLKTKEDIEKLREGGKRLAQILAVLKGAVAPGVYASELNTIAEKLVFDLGDTPAFLHYKPAGAKRPYPASLCVSINDEIVHGIPNGKPEKILKEGDIVTLDMGLSHKGLIVDSAITVGVGNIDEKAKKLLKITEEALYLGIKSAKGGARIGDIGTAIEKHVVGNGFSLAEELAGHGVGYAVHEEPYVPNFGIAGAGPILKPGMVIAIEPMCNEGDSGIITDDNDGYTIRTVDGSRSAHFEHTILITSGSAEILTK